MADQTFVNGIKAFKPGDKAPDFIIANLKFSKSELLEFLKTQPDEFKAVVKRSSKGGYYVALDTFVPKAKEENLTVKNDLPW